MRKTLFMCLLLLLLFAVHQPSAFADSILEGAAEAAGTDELTSGFSEEERSILGAEDVLQDYDAQGALARFRDYVLERAKTELCAQFAFAGRMIALLLFCALSEALTDHAAAKEGIALTACCCAAAWIAGDWDSGITQALHTLDRLSDYSRAALPVLYTAAAAAGAVSSAPIRYAAASLATEVMMTISRSLVLPFIYAYLALSLTLCICASPILRVVQRLIRRAAFLLLSIATSAFGLYVGLSGLVAASTDALAVKAARTVLSGVLPVVGGILADSAAALVSAAAVIRNAAGALSLLAVCLICAGPLVFLLVKMLLLRALCTFAEVLPGGMLPRFLGDCGDVFSLLIGMVGSSAVMLFFSLMTGLKAVNG